MIADPLSCNPYDALREALIDLYSASERERLDKLLSELDSADYTPSLLFYRIQELMEHSKSDITLVREAWLQRFPNKVTSILAIFVDTATLDQLAKAADAIIKLSPTGFNRVDPKPVDTAISSSMNAICARISHLERLLSAKPSYSRSHSKPRTKRAKNLCWYHHEYGSSARKCETWCTFNGAPRGQRAAQRAHVRHADAITQR